VPAAGVQGVSPYAAAGALARAPGGAGCMAG